MEELNKYLSNKHVVLNSEGVKFDDNYYSVMNSSSSLVETTYMMGKYTASLSSRSFGSTSNVSIPNQSFLGNTYLNVVFRIPPGYSLARGALFSMIAEVTYLMGSSSSSSITLSGESMFSALMAQCETEEKRSKMFRLAGEAVVQDDNITSMNACIPLLFPFSGACSKLYFDTSLLSNNIVITIKFKDAATVYGDGPISGMPTEFVSSKITFRQGELSNISLSLRKTMQMNPEIMSVYPYTHFQSFQSPTFDGSTIETAPCQVNLQGFINSDLYGIIFYVVNVNFLNATGAAGNHPNTFKTNEVSNIKLYYNGIPLYIADGLLYKLVNMEGTQNNAGWDNTRIVGAGGGAGGTTLAGEMVYIDFTRLRSACYPGEYKNTTRYANQVFQLTFNTTPETGVASDQFRCFATYIYPGACEIKGGQTFLYFD